MIAVVAAVKAPAIRAAERLTWLGGVNPDEAQGFGRVRPQNVIRFTALAVGDVGAVVVLPTARPVLYRVAGVAVPGNLLNLDAGAQPVAAHVGVLVPARVTGRGPVAKFLGAGERHVRVV